MKKLLLVCFIIFAMLFSSCDINSDTNPASETTVSEQTSMPEETTVPEDTDSNQSLFAMPDQSYIGVWSTDEAKTDEILIYEITSDTVKFNAGVFREFGFTATAVESNGEIVFGDGISPDYSGPSGMKGRLSFEENAISLTYDSFGTDFDYLEDGAVYKFTIKHDNSDELVESFKETLAK